MAGTPSDANWLNFRTTAAPTSPVMGAEGPNETYNLGDIYPSTRKIGGVLNQGWVAANSITNNDGTYSAPHNYGTAASTTQADAGVLRVNGFVTGHVYRLWMALGLLWTTFQSGHAIYTDSGFSNLIKGVAGTSTLPTGQIMDINGNVHANASAWAGSQTSFDWTATGPDLYFSKYPGGNNAYYQSIGIEDLSAAARASNLSMMGV